MSDLPTSSAAVNETHGTGQGVALAVGATCIWGMFPLVFKTVAHINMAEVIAHRSLWALVFAALLMVILGRREIFQRTLYTRRNLTVAALSGLVVAVNWGGFIWAIIHDQVLQSSLGYYISPLVSVVLGVVFLHERLRFKAWVAVGFAATGVVLLVWHFGVVPWAALTIAVSWAIYGLVRKLAPVGSLPGLYLETMMLSPLALGYIVWMYMNVGGVGSAESLAFGATLPDSLKLIATGAVTALPLLLFARATRILRLSTIGVLTFIVPTAQFSLAIFVFHEPFTLAHLWAFAFIWLGLVLYTWDKLSWRKPAPIPV